MWHFCFLSLCQTDKNMESLREFDTCVTLHFMEALLRFNSPQDITFGVNFTPVLSIFLEHFRFFPPKASSHGLNSTAFFENSYKWDPLNPNTTIGLWETFTVPFAITTLGDTPRCAVTTEDKTKNIFLTSVLELCRIHFVPFTCPWLWFSEHQGLSY